MNIDSADEVLVEVEFNNGVVESVDELEREWKESLQVGGLQGVKFSCGVVGGEEKSSRVYLVDKKSTNNCPLSFSVVPGLSLIHI